MSEGSALSRPLVVLSHLRWSFVWQRPQHLVSRLGPTNRCWFVEEPMPADVSEPTPRIEASHGVTRVWLDLPRQEFADGHVGFGRRINELYDAALVAIGVPDDAIFWIYSPSALELAHWRRPALVVYDVMDDLSAFRGASPALRLQQLQAFQSAGVVFAGGRSLYTAAARHAGSRAHLFPSGVDPDHYRPSRAKRRARPNASPVAGYLGVIDERIDLGLVAGLAAELPEWRIRLVGPVAKIDPDELPTAPNIEYVGQRQYAELPDVLAGFDVALMPFAINDATRSISPTKTLEYFAAGLPVVSTRVADVVADHGRTVRFADDAAGFANACRAAWSDPAAAAGEVERTLELNRWDAIASRMRVLIEAALAVTVSEADETA